MRFLIIYIFIFPICNIIVYNGVIYGLLESFILIINPQISGMIVDDVIRGGNRELLPKLILILILSTLARSLLRFWFLQIFEKSSQGMLYTMRIM